MLSFSTEQHAIEGAIWASPNREGPFSGKLLNASGAAAAELSNQPALSRARAAKYAHPGILGRRRLPDVPALRRDAAMPYRVLAGPPAILSHTIQLSGCEPFRTKKRDGLESVTLGMSCSVRSLTVHRAGFAEPIR